MGCADSKLIVLIINNSFFFEIFDLIVAVLQKGMYV